MGRSLAVLLACAGVAATGLVVGCGPSFQAVYEGDVRFEHCYALDQSAGGPDAKKECWREWLHGYTFGQSSDRIEYAAARFSELSLDPTLPSVDTGARPTKRSRTAAPMPTSAFAPPPNVAGEGPAPAPLPSLAPQPPPSPPPTAAPAVLPVTSSAIPAPHVVQAVARAPGEECTNACADRWNGCRRGCAGGACDACDRAYRACVPGCFQDVRHPPRSLR